MTDQLGKQSQIGFIGAGRLGSSLASAMTGAGYNVVALSSRRAGHRQWLSERFPSASVMEDGADVAELSEVVFITTSDAAIHDVAGSIAWRPGQVVLHCSGAQSLECFDAARAAGAHVGGIHPLQTFPSPESSDALQGITFGIESQDRAVTDWLNKLATDLGGNAYPLTTDQRAAYHAAAVMACGLLAGLTGLAAEVWAASGGISRADAVAALVPLVKTTANSVGINGLPNALTGPYVRGDVETVMAHVEATTNVSNEMGIAYAALANAALHIAKEQGNLSSDAERTIKRVLTQALKQNCENIKEA